MWIKFKVWYEDGLYRYQPGMEVDIPTDLAQRYVMAGKAVAIKPPKDAMQGVPGANRRKVPSARSVVRVRKVSTQPSSLMDLASAIPDED